FFLIVFFCFFFQAEDGIRDFHVTEVQTCALPILTGERYLADLIEKMAARDLGVIAWVVYLYNHTLARRHPELAVENAFGDKSGRSEERRVGKECRSRWWPDHEKKRK